MGEVAASIQNITPECRVNRGTEGALSEALDRIRATYRNYVIVPDNKAVTWRISLVRVEDDPLPSKGT